MQNDRVHEPCGPAAQYWVQQCGRDPHSDEEDRRRICGLPPTYTVLEAVRPAHGKVLHYDQYLHPRGYESVSYASVAFYR